MNGGLAGTLVPQITTETLQGPEGYIRTTPDQMDGAGMPPSLIALIFCWEEL